MNDTWVSGQGESTLQWPLIPQTGSVSSGLAWTIPVTHIRMTMQVDGARLTATNGIISGVIPTAEFVEDMQQFIGATGPAYCTGPVWDSFASQIEEASDILQDGTQDPAQVCDGISIGIGFNAARVQLGAIAPAPTMSGNQCPSLDAGMPDGGTQDAGG